jgi:circadian clock protein KaiB
MTWPAPPPPENYVLRLFVAGTTTRSQSAISSIRRICDQFLAGRFDLEIIDVYVNPAKTRDYQVVATPTLVKVSPEPLRRVVGDLSDQARVLASLGLSPFGGAPEVVA